MEAKAATSRQKLQRFQGGRDFGKGHPSGSNNSRTNYIVNGSEVVARRIIPESGSETTEYLHRNHLNQAVNPTNFSTGFGASSMYGQPFGSGGTDQFSGHKDDPESGVHYNLARSYNPVMSRWPSADSITTNVDDPQSLNKYTYARNNPVNRVDPDGNSPMQIDFPCEVGVGEGREITTCTAIESPLMHYLRPPKPPRPSRFDRKVPPALRKAKHNLANPSEDCLELLKALEITEEDLDRLVGDGGIFDTVSFANGATSEDNLWAVMGAAVTGTTNTTTVADLFSRGTPPWPSDKPVDGLSAPSSSVYSDGMIYLRESTVTWENIVHEAIHQLGGMHANDPWLLASLGLLYGSDPYTGGINVRGPSSQISEKIKEKCK